MLYSNTIKNDDSDPCQRKLQQMQYFHNAEYGLLFQSLL